MKAVLVTWLLVGFTAALIAYAVSTSPLWTERDADAKAAERELPRIDPIACLQALQNEHRLWDTLGSPPVCASRSCAERRVDQLEWAMQHRQAKCMREWKR